MVDAGRRGAEAVPRVAAVRESLVRVALNGAPARRNEVAFVLSGGLRLQAEVLRIRGDIADLQVFEDTRGLRAGDPVEMTGELLSATLGPGLLGQVFDGLQTPLQPMRDLHGTFLLRGLRAPAVDPARRFVFQPALAVGAAVAPGAVLGTVPEGVLMHPILAPLDLPVGASLVEIASGDVAAEDTVAVLALPDGSRRNVGLYRRWPVRRPFADTLVAQGLAERRFPDVPLLTGIRLIDTLFPVARGGTACVPGPFGAGKTVLLNLIARFAEADVVVVVACGERAGEVTETIETFPTLPDPRTGGALIDRTVIICNTSAMPVSARESSIYLGATIGEYYRSLGLDVLLLADSTSRWAQALRETSGFMEEIPGDEAFPAYLDSAIKALYERSGVVTSAGRTGSLTMIGTVSPAGGNLEEPVTQATLGTVKAFLGLSAPRAYRRAYPAIDPLISWSRYREQLAPWFREHCGPQWEGNVRRLTDLLAAGDAMQQLVAVAGDDGVAMDDFLTMLKAELVDAVFLQQNAMDPVDASTPLARQSAMLDLMVAMADAAPPPASADADDSDKEIARVRYAELASLLRNLNASPSNSPAYENYLARAQATLAPGPATR